MNIVFYSTNDLPVDRRVDDGYISLTDMAKSQRKRLDNWLRFKETTSLLRQFQLVIMDFAANYNCQFTPLILVPNAEEFRAAHLLSGLFH